MSYRVECPECHEDHWISDKEYWDILENPEVLDTDLYTPYCDKCNEKITSKMYDAVEFELEYKTGSCYPEGGNGNKYQMELCSKCSEDCIELLKDNGYRINESEWDY